MSDENLKSNDLEMESKSWNKMERNLKLFGFREGASKGKEDGFQLGFDLGYSHGFEMGEVLGSAKGVLSCFKLFNPNENVRLDLTRVENLALGSCLLCPESEVKGKVPVNEETYAQGLDEIVLKQKSRNDLIKKSLEGLHNQLKTGNG